ncbi:acetyl-CoA carboxylase biotin carboxylase subunit family protein [Streptomyces sp. NPDC001678]|uniref:ATP-grasp domain-containing protein n=1 Tax=Streptomyces sp. NPDC001678 TaxID=3364599 RepID=UPI00369D72D4
MKNILLFSRRPLRRRPLQDWLGDAAARVVLVTPRSAVEGAEEIVTRRFLGHRLVDSYDSWAADLAAEAAAREFGVGLVASTSEDDVIRAARLRERLGLPGQRPVSAFAYRDKAVMKELIREAGLAVPHFAPVDHALDLLDFIDAHGYPVVVKPRFGAGAEGVAMLYTDKDLDAFLTDIPRLGTPLVPGQWMAETFVRAPFFHVDGIMRDGAVIHSWPAQYSGGVAEHLKESVGIGSVLLDPADERTPLLQNFAADVIAALPPTDQATAFHLEAWIDGDGRPVLCEIASRAGGALVAEVYEEAFGVHLAREGLRAQCELPLSLTVQPATPRAVGGWLLLPPGHGRFSPPTGTCPVPGVSLTVHLDAGTSCAGAQYAGHTAASVLATAAPGDPADTVSGRLTEAAEWWARHAGWT